MPMFTPVVSGAGNVPSWETAMAAANGWVQVQIPSVIGWDETTYPVRLYRSVAGAYYCTKDPKDVVNSGIWAATAKVYYVNQATGSDANDGLTLTTPKKGIHAAITALNAASETCGRIYVAGGTYDNADGWTSSSTAVRLTKHCAFIATGPVITHSGVSTLTWTVHSGTTYKATRNQIGTVLQDYTTELTNVADAATCVSTAGSWVEVAGVVYVHRSDDAAVTNANTRVLLWTLSALFDAVSLDVYFEGFTFQGGRYGALDLTDGPTTRTFSRNAAVVNCTMQYGGYPSARAPGLAADRFTGLLYVKGCTASKNSSDGFNYHANGSVTLAVLEVGCTSSANGKFGETSGNGSTGHEAVKALLVQPTHATAAGATIHFIQTSKVAVIGGSAACTDATASSACIKIDNTAVAWAEGVSLTGSGGSGKTLYNNGTGAFYSRNVTTVDGVTSGTVTAV